MEAMDVAMAVNIFYKLKFYKKCLILRFYSSILKINISIFQVMEAMEVMEEASEVMEEDMVVDSVVTGVTDVVLEVMEDMVEDSMVNSHLNDKQLVNSQKYIQAIGSFMSYC